MQRYFITEKNNNKIKFNKDDSYHIRTVMRNKEKDQVEVVINNKLYQVELTSIKEIVEGKIIQELKQDNNKRNIILAQSLVPEKKWDLILQKATELGIKEIIPLQTERSKVKINNEENKHKRWNKILKEASEQSKRLDIPTLNKITTIKELSNVDYQNKILLSVNKDAKKLKDILKNINTYDIIIIIVGPEGGLTNEEENILEEKGYIKTSLGDLVLRTETASIAALSMINYHFMR